MHQSGWQEEDKIDGLYSVLLLHHRPIISSTEVPTADESARCTPSPGADHTPTYSTWVTISWVRVGEGNG